MTKIILIDVDVTSTTLYRIIQQLCYFMLSKNPNVYISQKFVRIIRTNHFCIYM